MAVLEVLPYPNESLRRQARPVTQFDADLARLVADMEETMNAEDGVGLAATQVGVDLQLLLVHPYAFKGDEARDEPVVVVINPEVVWQSDEKIVAEEGCLSFPDVFIHVARPAKVRLRALNLKAEAFEIEGEGLGARALLHEVDHLRGVVMIDHVSFLQRQRALKKHQKHQADLADETRRRAAKAAKAKIAPAG
jgi:peptide deformylase